MFSSLRSRCPCGETVPSSGDGAARAIFGVAEEGIDELAGIELDQVVRLLANADVRERDAEIADDREGDAALRGAVEFDERDVRHVHALREDARLMETVLACVRVDDEQ